MDIKKYQKIFLIVVIIGFIVALFPPVFFRTCWWYARQPVELFYTILHWGLSGIVTLLAATYLFSSEKYKAMRSVGNISKKVVDFIFRITLTVIVAIISWTILSFVGFGYCLLYRFF